MKKHDQPNSYIIQLSAHVYLNVYMLALAGQTAGPNRQTNFEGYQGRPVSKNSFFFK